MNKEALRAVIDQEDKQKPLSDRGWDCGWHGPTLYAGFPHFHFSGCPDAARRFVAACARFSTK